jgi:putative phosphoribosyl transferase
MMFANRIEAGRLLAERLTAYRGKENGLILAIPRGGIPLACEISRKLGLPVDVLVIKKIGVPGNEELAAGATGIDEFILNEAVVSGYGVSEAYIQEQVEKKRGEIRERYRLLRGDRPLYSVENRTVILVDDGIATGSTMAMAIRMLQKQAPGEVVLAVPVAPPDTVRRLEKIADHIVCLDQPRHFMAIGQFYEDFTQVRDEEAKEMLDEVKV